MRYQELRAARETLINAVSHLINNPQQITILSKKVDIAALFVLRTALQEVREELKHPERFNLDGSRRPIRITQPYRHYLIHPIAARDVMADDVCQEIMKRN